MQRGKRGGSCNSFGEPIESRQCAASELALHQIEALPFHIVIPTPTLAAAVPVRSTGSSDIIQNIQPVIGALANTTMVVDCTVEGLLHCLLYTSDAADE
mgnify:CR=1 FL=1